jgi:hypothetical protein
MALPRTCAAACAAAAGLAGLSGLATPAAADSRPALDDFYDRTRDRDEGFVDCLGYCDGRRLAAFLVGVAAANPSSDALRPKLATGGRLGIDLAVRGGYADIARTKLWADVLRVNETGDWLADLAWQTTAFAALARPGAAGLHLSFDSLLAQRTELEPSDLAQLQRRPYRVADVEAEVAPTGGKVDKDAFIAIPLGVAARLRWPEDGALERRTAISGALAFRGFPKGIRHHYQLDALRVKHTSWDVPGGTASSWTLSAGYQRLSPDIEGLQIWLLGGYEWAGDRRGPVVQVGAELRIPTAHGILELGPRFEEHLELDPETAMFTRVYEGRLYARHRHGRPGARLGAWWGLAYEAVILEDAGRLHALTPEAGVAYRGLELGLRYRLARTYDEPMMTGAPGDRFQLALDRRF